MTAHAPPVTRVPARRPAAGAVAPSQAAGLAQRVCAIIDAHPDSRHTLAGLGLALHVSPFHVQRVFKKVMGITPHQYADSRRLVLLKDTLRAGVPVTEALYDAGYGAPSRLYTRAQARLGMTPGAYRRGGEGKVIHYAVVPCPLGRLLVAATPRGICAVRLGDDDASMETQLRSEFPAAEVQKVEESIHPWVRPLVDYLTGALRDLDVPLDIKATAFQRRVWDHLRTIPYGETRSYSAVANAIGAPKAMRAVGGACAANPVLLIVPCHRVIRGSGALGGYAGGIDRKRALLHAEWLAVDGALRAAASLRPSPALRSAVTAAS